MGLEALQWDNLINVAEEARDKYVNFSDNLPGDLNCSFARDFIAEKLYKQLGKELFRIYISCASFDINKGGNHYLIIVGDKKTSFKETFASGIKIDPTIYQFKDIHPKLGSLNRQCVFNGDYPRIYIPDSLSEYDLFSTLLTESE
jgi:hypothetical protein